MRYMDIILEVVFKPKAKAEKPKENTKENAVAQVRQVSARSGQNKT